MSEIDNVYKPLEKAVHEDNLENFKNILENQPDVVEFIRHYHEEHKWSLVIDASCYGAIECLKYLIPFLYKKMEEAGESREKIYEFIHAKNVFGNAPIHKAVEERHLECAEFLLKEGANPNEIIDKKFSSLGETPMSIACYNDDLEMLKLLIRYGGKLDSRSKSNCTLLHLAAINNAFHCVKYLIDKGFDVNARNDEDCVPLHYAQSYHNHIESTILLLHHGADVNAVSRRFKRTPLHEATMNNRVKAVKLLLDYGADINAQDVYGNTPLHLAIHRYTQVTLYDLDGEATGGTMMSQWGAFKMLLKHHPNLEIYNSEGNDPMYSSDGDTPLLYAARQNSGMMKVLLQKGADVHARNIYSGKSALDIIMDKLYDNLSHGWGGWGYLKQLDIIYPYLNDEEKKIVDAGRARCNA